MVLQYGAIARWSEIATEVSILEPGSEADLRVRYISRRLLSDAQSQADAASRDGEAFRRYFSHQGVYFHYEVFPAMINVLGEGTSGLVVLLAGSAAGDAVAAFDCIHQIGEAFFRHFGPDWGRFVAPGGPDERTVDASFATVLLGLMISSNSRAKAAASDADDNSAESADFELRESLMSSIGRAIERVEETDARLASANGGDGEIQHRYDDDDDDDDGDEDDDDEHDEYDEEEQQFNKQVWWQNTKFFLIALIFVAAILTAIVFIMLTKAGVISEPNI